MNARKPSNKIQLYGVYFSNTVHPAQREIDMLRHGGRWKNPRGDWVGEGMEFHFKRFQEIIYGPDKVWHRWNTLQMECFLKYRSIGVIGPASSGKTNSGATDALAFWYVWFDCTTVLCCSTTRERLEDRVWGEIKKYHRIAKARVGWLPGHLIEGRQRIIADPKGDTTEGRDFRNGLTGVPCFLSGTLVDTPSGKVPIERVKIGDTVLNALGVGTVTRTHANYSASAVRVSLSDGRAIDCTDEHPFFTTRGWVNARDLKTSDRVLSACEALSILRGEFGGPLAAHEVLRSILQEESDWFQKRSPARNAHARRTCGLEAISRFDFSLPRSDWFETHEWKCPLVSIGYSISDNNACCGNRRRNPSNPEESEAGFGAHRNFTGAWVDRVEILEQTGDERFIRGEGGYRVYNLSVSGHPSYSVNGVLVHNCKKGTDYVGISDYAGIKNKNVILLGDELSLLPRAFVDATSNLDKNPVFKLVGLGNPKETTDALGVLCEPAPHLGGWEGGLDQRPGTKTWETRRPQGVCIQFPGDDSPNLDGKMAIPLITQEQIDRDIAFYGKDSLWYTMMDLGRMPRGQGSRRVITRQMCLKFRAMEDAVWADTNQTIIGCLDAAYRGVGGDRCVLMFLKFGKEVPVNPVQTMTALLQQKNDWDDRRQILSLVETIIVPINPALDVIPEDQITMFCRDQCIARGVPPGNFWYDAGMRTSLVQSFSRIWSPGVESIDFGGRPSEGNVSSDIKVSCRDYYSKFVTELWFNVRLVIECSQMRGMNEDLVMEGASREWKMVGANKIEVETKEEMKKKIGRSPDLFDCLACGVYGAIKRGFAIARITAKNNGGRGRRGWDWRTELKQKASELWKAGTLEAEVAND